jgi:hypothetical protein
MMFIAMPHYEGETLQGAMFSIALYHGVTSLDFHKKKETI